MEYFKFFYFGGFMIALFALGWIRLGEGGIDAWQVVRIFLRKVFQAIAVLALGFLLAMVLGAVVGKGSLFDREGRGMLADSWSVAGFVFLPTVLIIWDSVVKEEKRKREAEKDPGKKHRLKLKG
ncbi:hypothetical protein [Chitinophaga rhizosphaerae]|uniref:hypothetical protein n=1 Tax=Chitinophaga rhizosphaerae TaxID=1864947 RepID=UPI000F813D8C|nr:hypothetical protein [Chitinophaga rhizosphaerae]